MISKTSLQIIKALLELAKLPIGDAQGVVRIAEKIEAPPHYLAKVLQGLVREGIVVSQKGLNGGFRLSKPPKEITLYDVVSCLEDVKSWEGCFMGNSVCSEKTACSAHQYWMSAREAYMKFLKNTTIADLKEK